jgi:phosphoglycerate dehydrogenase-like enzyme
MRNPGNYVDGSSVLITWPDYPDDRSQVGAQLIAAGLLMRRAPKLADRTSHELCQLAAGAVAAIVSTDPFDARVFELCTALRVVARVGIGVDSIDLAAASAAGVAVTTTPGVNESTTADHTVALMLAAIRRVAEHDAAVRRGEWPRSGEHVPWDLAGATVGLIGYGRIGKLVARRLEGFDVRIIISDPNEPATNNTEHVELDELLRTAHVISVHTPLLAETRRLIGHRELALMRHDAILVNTARGGVVDEQALLDALESRQIRGAALDVFETEPPRSERLLALGNVVLSPHVGGISEQSVEEMVRQATGSVLDVLAGRIPDGLVNHDVLAHAQLVPAASRTGSPEAS